MVFTVEIIKKCFPHKEAVLFNLDTAITIAYERESHLEDERIDKLCKCHAYLRASDIEKAIECAVLAHYHLMAEAIKLHWGA